MVFRRPGFGHHRLSKNLALNQKASVLHFSWWVPEAVIRQEAKLPDSDFTPSTDSAGSLINHPTAH